MRLNSHSSAGHVMNEKTPTLKVRPSLFCLVQNSISHYIDYYIISISMDLN